jgi:hypothetical protein
VAAAPFFNSAKPREISPQKKRTLKNKIKCNLLKIVSIFFGQKKEKRTPPIYCTEKKGH